jgi:hypothetical protein
LRSVRADPHPLPVDNWSDLWISSRKKAGADSTSGTLYPITFQLFNNRLNQPTDPTGHRSPANCHDLTRPAPLLSARQTPSILPSYRKPLPGNLLQFRYQTVTKARADVPPEWGSLTQFFLLSLALADPEQSAKGLQMLKFQITKEDAIGGTKTEIKEFKTLKEFWKYTSKNYIQDIKTLESN